MVAFVTRATTVAADTESMVSMLIALKEYLQGMSKEASWLIRACGKVDKT